MFDSENRGFRRDYKFDLRTVSNWGIFTCIGEDKIVHLVLPDTAIAIMEGSVFNFFDNLKTVSGAGITSISDQTFAGRTALTSVNFPAAVSIGNQAFANCTSLTTISITSTVTNIDGRAFLGCLNLRFTASGIYSALDSGKMLVKDGSKLVLYPSATGAVTLPASITSINTGVFSGFTTLTSISAPGLTTIGDSAFAGCTTLNSITASNLTTIGNQAFANCGALTSVNITGAASIGIEAFINCGDLTAINLTSTAGIGVRAFSGCAVGLNFNITGGNGALAIVDGGILIRNGEDGAALVFYPSANGDITLDSSITSINGGVFQSMNVTSITAENVLSVGDAAFFFSELAHANLPLVTEIGARAFAGSTLQTLYIPSVTYIGARAFAHGGFYPHSKIITLGPNPPTLGEYIFAETQNNAVTVRVPASSLAAYQNPLPEGGSWVQGFLGKGWNGTGYVNADVSINPSNSVTFETY